MTTVVYYNFPELTLNLTGGTKNPSSQKIQLTNPGQPTTNIQLNEINYSAVAIYVARDDHNPKYLILECLADINDLNSNKIYLAVPLKIVGEKEPNSDVDNIIGSKGGEVKLTVNKYIKSDSDCIVNTKNKDLKFPITIVLKDDSAIPVHSTSSEYLYALSSFPDLNTSIEPVNGKMHQKDLDWIMSCELLTEDGPEEKQLVDPGATATTITMFLMSIMIAGTTYLFAPIIYKDLKLYDMVNNKLNQNHYALNVYFGITLVLMGLLCLVQGMASNSRIYYFMTVGIILSFFAGTSAILKLDGISNDRGSGFKTYENTFQVFRSFIFAKCYDVWLKVLIIILYLGALSGMFAGLAIKNHSVFFGNLIAFFIVSLLPLIFIYYSV
jgi:hypothetical protein